MIAERDTILMQITHPRTKSSVVYKAVDIHNQIRAVKIMQFGNNPHFQDEDLYFQGVIRKRLDYLMKLHEYPSVFRIPKQIIEWGFTTHSTRCSQLYIARPFFHMDTLNELLENESSSILDKIDLKRQIRKLIQISIAGMGMDHFILTTENTYYSTEKGEIQADYTNFCGCLLDQLSKHQRLEYQSFKQIYMYLCKGVFTETATSQSADVNQPEVMKRQEEREEERQSVNVWIRMRSIAIILLSLIIKKAIPIKIGQQITPFLTYEEMAAAVRDLNLKYKTILSIKHFQELIKLNEEEYGIPFASFFQRVLINEESTMTWNDLRNILLPKSTSNSFKKEIQTFNALIQKYFLLQDQKVQKIYKRKRIVDSNLGNCDLYFMVSGNLDIKRLLKYGSIVEFMKVHEHSSQTSEKLYSWYLQIERKILDSDFTKLNLFYPGEIKKQIQEEKSSCKQQEKYNSEAIPSNFINETESEKLNCSWFSNVLERIQLMTTNYQIEIFDNMIIQSEDERTILRRFLKVGLSKEQFQILDEQGKD